LSLNNFTTECMHFLLARPWVARLPICHALYEPPTHALYEPPTHALYEPPTHALYEPPTHALYEMLTHRGHDAREAACQWSASKNGSVNKAPEHMPGRWRCAVANTCTHLICGTSALPGQSFACAVHRRTSTVPKPLSQAHSYKSLAPTAAPPLCAASTGWAVGSRGPGAAAPQGYRLTAPQSVIWCSCWGPAIDGALASMPPAHLPLRCQALAAGGRRSRHTYGIPRSSGRGVGVTGHIAPNVCCSTGLLWMLYLHVQLTRAPAKTHPDCPSLQEAHHCPHPGHPAPEGAPPPPVHHPQPRPRAGARGRVWWEWCCRHAGLRSC